MKFSVARTEFTPTGPIFLAGFGFRKHQSVGVLAPVYLNTVLLQANKTVLIVGIDALGSDRSFIVGIKDALQERFGLTHDEVLINFSHTHHSVALTGVDESLRLPGYSIAQEKWETDISAIDYSADEALFYQLRDALIALVAECYETLTEGKMLLTRGSSDLAISRRLLSPEGEVAWAPNDEAEIDKDLFVLKLQNTAGELKSIIYAYGCHTTAMGGDDYLISNDFAGFTNNALQENHPGIIPVFLQACAGELKPRESSRDGQFFSCTPAQAEAIGRGFATDIEALIAEDNFSEVKCHFKTLLQDPSLPTVKGDPAFYQSVIDASGLGSYEGNAARRTLEALANGTAKERRPLYIAVWQLDSETTIVAIEGEVSTEYSLELKKLFGNGKLIVLGYTNGVMTYIPTRKMLAEGGYEAECNYFFGFQGPFAPEIDDIIIGRVAQMLHSLK